ncbi:MAG: HAD family hydrolase [Cyanobacteria bacterium SZAS-4]|nr:HAD family hydrolase [Cyanobacteria bacterium SZAS-4]
MWFIALATDYDGTVAADGVIDEPTLATLRKFSKSGRKLILVTGRQLKDLLVVCPQLDIFDLVVTENGAVLYFPSTKEERLIASEPPANLVAALTEKKIQPLDVGKCVVATWHPNENIVLETIRSLGLEHQVIFNKGAVMVLPPGVNKASGLEAALKELALSRHNVVGAGDAENDLAFLTACECSVAVANALPSVKEAADITTNGSRGAGVSEVLEMVMNAELEKVNLSRHDILIGTDADGKEIFLDTHGKGMLIAGTSGSGKSTAVTGIIERLAEKDYQFCLIDPEGDFEVFEHALTTGNSQHAPTIDEAAQHFKLPNTNIIINLLGVPLAERPQFLGDLLPRLKSLRDTLGRPHWIVIDEAHHMMPKNENHVAQASASDMIGTILITVHPDELAQEALSSLDKALIVGTQPKEMLEKFAAACGDSKTFDIDKPLEPGEAFFWQRTKELQRIKVAPPHTERRRHLKKYAEGDVGHEKSFFFTGADKHLNLRVQNLILFVQISEGIDDETWLYHLRNAEYSKWFADAIKDESLAKETAAIEENQNMSASESKAAIHDLIKSRYTASATGPQLNSASILK